MKKLIIASLSGLALLSVAACSDSTDTTTTQSINPPADSTTAVPPAVDNAAPQVINPAPSTGTGGDMQPAPTQPGAPAPAQ